MKRLNILITRPKHAVEGSRRFRSRGPDQVHSTRALVLQTKKNVLIETIQSFECLVVPRLRRSTDHKRHVAQNVQSIPWDNGPNESLKAGIGDIFSISVTASAL